ncbi:hypothetical protein ACNOYE_03875 [Nannocystaceae bacterium ST9]
MPIASSGCDGSDPSTYALVELTNKENQLENRKEAVNAGLAEISRLRADVEALKVPDDASRQKALDELDVLLRSRTQEPQVVPDEGLPEASQAPTSSDEQTPDAVIEVIVGMYDTSFAPLEDLEVALDPELDATPWVSTLRAALPNLDYQAMNRMQSCRGELYSPDSSAQLRECRRVLTLDLTRANFDALKSKRTGELQRLKDALEVARTNLERELKSVHDAVEDQKKKLEQSSRTLVAAIFGMIAILVTTLLSGRRYYRKGELGPAFSHVVLPLVTVMVLVFAILLLGLGGKFESETLGTLIAGISGYVLGKNLTTDPPPKLTRGPNFEQLAETLLGRLAARRIELTEDDFKRILACRESEQLERWLEHAKDANRTKADQILVD